MRRRQGRAGFHEPSLVPLADMLCNTVGVTVFILIFTVLTASGAVLMKRLPFESPTKKERILVVCYHNRILPLDLGAIEKLFDGKINHPGQLTYSNVGAYIDQLNHVTVEDDYFTVTHEASLNYNSISVVTMAKPKDTKGDDFMDLDGAGSTFRTQVEKGDPSKQFFFFIVYPDSISIFNKARDIAREKHFDTGWNDQKDGKPIGFASGGRASNTQ